MIHVEFGHFSNPESFEVFEKYAVRNADSLGMNEMEMKMLLDYWKGDLHSVENNDSTPSLDQVLRQINEIFEQSRRQGLKLSRVHTHPYGSFLICYDQSKWESAEDAIVKSSIVVPKYCLRDQDGNTPADWAKQVSNFEIPSLPSQINTAQEPIFVKKDTLTYDFALNDDGIHCYLQFFMKCKKMFKTAGMGDTISGTGWIYHTPKNSP